MIKMKKSRGGNAGNWNEYPRCDFHFLSFCYGVSMFPLLYSIIFYIIPLYIIPLFK
jgi:hypothetical protein